jgi:hypothetical protein
MEHGNGAPDSPLHTLIPLADFKAILGIDDRENALSRYCLITATFTIEQYCKRRLLRRKNTDYLTFYGGMRLYAPGIPGVEGFGGMGGYHRIGTTGGDPLWP